MVSYLSIIFMVISLLVCFGVPFVLAAIFKKKGLSTWKVFFIGMLGFVITQMAIRIPLLQVIGLQSWFISMSENLLVLALFLAITAALFETVGRFLVFKFLLKKNKTYGDGLMAGLGHGGIEAIIIVGFTYINNIVLSIMINLGMSDLLFGGSSASPAAQAGMQSAIDALTNTPAPSFLLGGFERILTIIIHIALSLLVLEGIKRKKTLLYMFFAFLAHALLDFFGAYMAFQGVNTLLIELIVVGFALVGLWYIITAKKRFSIIEQTEEI
jgi:uncharacterized membrane protein YhfC